MIAPLALALLSTHPLPNVAVDPAPALLRDGVDEEARRILEEALAASLEIDRVGYSASRYTLRTDGDPSGLEVPLFAEVRMRDVESGDPGVQFVLRGSYYSEAGPDRERGFVAAWDGKTAELLNAGAAEPEHRTGDVRPFLGPLLALVPPELTDGGPLAAGLEAPELRFEGLALVSGQPCEVVRVGAPDGTTRYFVATTDRVVRRIERARAGTLEVLTITGLSLRPRWGEEAFVLRPVVAPARPTGPIKAQEARLPTGRPAPPFELRDDQGRTVRLADLAGELVVVDFWASWSPDCVATVPKVQKLHAEFGERGVRVFAVSVMPRADQPDPVASLRKLGATYPVLLEGDGLRPAYSVREVPALYVIDRRGEILWTSWGFDAAGAEERRIRSILSAALR